MNHKIRATKMNLTFYKRISDKVIRLRKLLNDILKQRRFCTLGKIARIEASSGCTCCGICGRRAKSSVTGIASFRPSKLCIFPVRPASLTVIVSCRSLAVGESPSTSRHDGRG